MFIITNRTATYEYTPSVADSLEEAKLWMIECTLSNLYAAYTAQVKEFLNIYKYEIKDIKTISLMEKLIDFLRRIYKIDCYITNYSSIITYSNDDFNAMKIYEITKRGKNYEYFTRV